MEKIFAIASILCLGLLTAGCNTTSAAKPDVSATGSSAKERFVQRGNASWYGPGFQGRKTANGERFQSQAMTAAHRTLPFGTRVRVVSEKTGRSVVVRINDRGPYYGGRIIDLAAAPAHSIGLVASGSGPVSLHRLD